jgi:hypothetical protein
MHGMRRLFSVLQEEEEGGYGPRVGGPAVAQAEPVSTSANSELLHVLAEERAKILDNDKFSAKEKLALLDDNRKAIVVANGGTVKRSENVVYGLLIFGGVGLIVLALLTTYAGLPHEVTISFVGTVLGGTIATIAQKLGNL